MMLFMWRKRRNRRNRRKNLKLREWVQKWKKFVLRS